MNGDALGDFVEIMACPGGWVTYAMVKGLEGGQTTFQRSYFMVVVGKHLAFLLLVV